MYSNHVDGQFSAIPVQSEQLERRVDCFADFLREQRKRMVKKLTEDQTIQFVAVYREHPCLWDITSENYRNKSMRDAALQNYVRICKLKVS